LLIFKGNKGTYFQGELLILSVVTANMFTVNLQVVYFCRTLSNMRGYVGKLKNVNIATSRNYITDVCCVSCWLIDRSAQVDASDVHVLTRMYV